MINQWIFEVPHFQTNPLKELSAVKPFQMVDGRDHQLQMHHEHDGETHGMIVASPHMSIQHYIHDSCSYFFPHISTSISAYVLHMICITYVIFISCIQRKNYQELAGMPPSHLPKNVPGSPWSLTCHVGSSTLKGSIRQHVFEMEGTNSSESLKRIKNCTSKT